MTYKIAQTVVGKKNSAQHRKLILYTLHQGL